MINEKVLPVSKNVYLFNFKLNNNTIRCVVELNLGEIIFPDYEIFVTECDLKYRKDLIRTISDSIRFLYDSVNSKILKSVVNNKGNIKYRETFTVDYNGHELKFVVWYDPIFVNVRLIEIYEGILTKNRKDIGEEKFKELYKFIEEYTRATTDNIINFGRNIYSILHICK